MSKFKYWILVPRPDWDKPLENVVASNYIILLNQSFTKPTLQTLIKLFVMVLKLIGVILASLAKH